MKIQTSQMKNLCFAAGVGVFLVTPALANIEVVFKESAPKDSFTITNISTCDLGAAVLVFDMTQSAGGLYFDTTDAGEGVEVFQPFEIIQGAENVLNSSNVDDGDTSITLNLSGLQANMSVAFTIDVDDKLRHSALGQIQVTGSEIQGALALLKRPDRPDSITAFDNTSTARIRVSDCVS